MDEPTKLIWYGIDLDKTLATHEHPQVSIGKPIEENISKLREVHAAGYKIVIYTARPWSQFMAIEKWLNKHSIPYKYIQCGKPLFLHIVDDKAINASEKSWLHKHKN